MLKFFKDWYNTHLTDPNQVALALLILFISIITYILLATVVPILVAIILAYMLEGIVKSISEKYALRRTTAVLSVYISFLILSFMTVILLVPVMLNQISLFIKSLPSMLERGKDLLLNSSNSESGLFSQSQISEILSGINSEISMLGSSIISFSLSSAGSLIETIVYIIIVPIMIFFLLYDKQSINEWFKKFFPEK